MTHCLSLSEGRVEGRGQGLEIEGEQDKRSHYEHQAAFCVAPGSRVCTGVFASMLAQGD